nr:DNA helicase [Tanacetum cinerariifolium]
MCPEGGQSPRFLQLSIYNTTNEVKNRLSHFNDQHELKLKEEIIEGLIEFLDTHNALVQLFRTAPNKYMEADILEFKVQFYNVIGTRQYELPTAKTIGAIMFTDSSATENEFDLIIEEHSQFPQRVNKLHPCYMSLQFPLLFVYGEDDYQKDMKIANIPRHCTKANKRMSMNMQKQNDIRSEYLTGIYDVILQVDRDRSDLGLRTVLTASFTSSPRYMYAHYIDALAICRVHGSPSFFITFNYNTKCLKIKEFMKPFPQLTTADRADIVDRIFEKKVCDYIDFVRDFNNFGNVTKELPDPATTYANTYAVISELMMHGPCGSANPAAACMKDGGNCNRNFPKPYCDKTYIDKDGFGTDRVIANVTRPSPNDPSTRNAPAIQIDEIKNYVEARYTGPHEPCWRILDFPIHYRNPPVQTLAVHLENMQQLTFQSKDNLQSIVNNPTKKTTLTEWQLADLLRQTDLIIWNEAPMNDHRCFEALDRSLKDISNSPNTFFGGTSIILGGDFRQTLPVKKKASKPEILDASIISSYLWPKFKTYTLTENMRLHQSETEAQRMQIQNFSTWLLNIGNGTIGDPDETDNQNTFVVQMPPELCIPDSNTALAALIHFIYDEKTLQTPPQKICKGKLLFVRKMKMQT